MEEVALELKPLEASEDQELESAGDHRAAGFDERRRGEPRFAAFFRPEACGDRLQELHGLEIYAGRSDSAIGFGESILVEFQVTRARRRFAVAECDC